jgi:two-component system, LytTR family, sensor kinase
MTKRTTRDYLRTYLIIFGVATMAYIVRLISGQFDDRLNWILYVTSLAAIAISWEFFRWVNYKLDEVFPYAKSIPGRVATQIGIGALFTIFIRFLIYEFGEPYLPIQLDSLFLASTWILYVLAGTAINTIFVTKFFLKQWKESIILAERLEKEKSQVQFDNLKNQMNPHFLFNALTSLNSLIFENQQLASDFLQQLSKVYRYVLQNKEKNFVTLQTEMDFIGNYVQLLETRFEKALAIKFDISAQSRGRAIVPVTLQILIENALKHNVVDKDRPLQIEILTVGDYLVVSNNLQLRKLVETSNKLGLENLKSLYRFLTDKPVLIEKTDERFAVKVPLV